MTQVATIKPNAPNRVGPAVIQPPGHPVDDPVMGPARSIDDRCNSTHLNQNVSCRLEKLQGRDSCGLLLTLGYVHAVPVRAGRMGAQVGDTTQQGGGWRVAGITLQKRP